MADETNPQTRKRRVNGTKLGGRKPKYKPELCKKAEFAAGRGFTDKDLAKMFGVDERTINRWKDDYPEFCQSLQRGKEIADDAVEKSLFQRATGYSHPDVHVSTYEGGVTITPIIKHYPPDTAAAFIWLKNRRPKAWRDRQEVKHEGLGGFMEFLAGKAAEANDSGNLTRGGQ